MVLERRVRFGHGIIGENDDDVGWTTHDIGRDSGERA